ncbi:hypothetical protein STEG23_022531 [Scotinomys teguina]
MGTLKRPCIMNSLSVTNGTFAINLLKMLCQNNPSGNVCYSPVSISSALAMVLLGAKGDTATQMSQALGLNTKEDNHGGFQDLLSNLNEPNRKYSLRTANRLFAESTFEFLPIFKESCLKFYHSELEQLSFVKAAEESRKHINTWVSKQTEGKIPKMLPDGSVDSETKLVLVNALYFKGRWQTEFDKEHTREMPFKINQREERPVQMMYQEDIVKLAYVDEVRAQVLEMPYEGKELSLIVLLPVHGVDLSKISFENQKYGSLTFMWCPEAGCDDGKLVDVKHPYNEREEQLAIMDPLQEANGTFTFNLLKILGEDSSKNVFFSPMSISSALAMVFMGAKGTTASQMIQF